MPAAAAAAADCSLLDVHLRQRAEMEAEAAEREAHDAEQAALEEEALQAEQAAAQAAMDEEPDDDLEDDEDDDEAYADLDAVVEPDPTEEEAVAMYGSAGPRDLDDGGRGPGAARRVPCAPLAPLVLESKAALAEADEVLGGYRAAVEVAPPTWLVCQPAAICPPPRQTDAAGAVTLVTQCSIDRLPRLHAQLLSWGGLASVAVFIRAPVGSDDASACEATVRQMLATLPDEVAQGVVVSLAYTPAADDASADGVAPSELPYPINALRNLAMSSARTELVFLLDVDFTLSPRLGCALRAGEHADLLAEVATARTAVVVPAFEIAPDCKLPTSRRQLLASVDSRRASLFHVGHFPRCAQKRSASAEAHMSPQLTRADPRVTPSRGSGHSPTRLATWRTAAAPYEVGYEEYYEPYVIVSRRWAAQYDERFVGYGLNKVSHIYQLACEGTRFVVLPEHFCIAREHSRSDAWQRIYGKAADPAEQQRLAQLYRAFKAALPPLEQQKAAELSALRSAPEQPTGCAAFFCPTRTVKPRPMPCCAVEQAQPTPGAAASAPPMRTMLRL